MAETNRAWLKLLQVKAMQISKTQFMAIVILLNTLVTTYASHLSLIPWEQGYAH